MDTAPVAPAAAAARLPAPGERAMKRGRTRRRHIRVTGAVAAGSLAGISALLAACSSAAPTPTAPGGASRAPVTIEVLTRNGVANPTGHSRWYADQTPLRFTPQTNVGATFVDGVPTPAAKHIVMASGGAPPDAVWYSAISDGFGGPAGARKGLFRPIDDLVKRDRFDKSGYWKSVMEMFSLDGKLFALPTHGSFGTNVLYVNQDLLRKAGITVPLNSTDVTTDQLIDWARQVTRRQDNVWGWWPQTGISEPVMLFLRTFGGDLLSPDGKRCVIDSPQAREALQWQYDCQYKFQIVDNLLPPTGPVLAFQEGRLAFHNWTPIRIANWVTPAGRDLVKFDWAATVFPKHPRGTRASMLSANGFGVTGTAKQDAAWEWIKWICNKENGVLQVEGGAGSPGARQDVWEDPRLAKLSPAYALLQKTYGQPAPFHNPANFKYAEVIAAADARLLDFWESRSNVNDTAASVAREVNAILQQPID